MSYYESNTEDEDRTGAYPFEEPGAVEHFDPDVDHREFELWVAAGLSDLEELLATHAAFDDWRETMRRRYGGPSAGDDDV